MMRQPIRRKLAGNNSNKGFSGMPAQQESTNQAEQLRNLQPSGNKQQACSSEAWFKYPQNGATYQAGADVYVRVDPKKYQDIEKIRLRVNGKNIGSD